jgi:hypothetical protein
VRDDAWRISRDVRSLKRAVKVRLAQLPQLGQS